MAAVNEDIKLQFLILVIVLIVVDSRYYTPL